jgi:hypothetical protein
MPFYGFLKESQESGLQQVNLLLRRSDARCHVQRMYETKHTVLVVAGWI